MSKPKSRRPRKTPDVAEDRTFPQVDVQVDPYAAVILETVTATVPFRQLPQGDVDYAAVRRVQKGKFVNFTFGIWREGNRGKKLIPLSGIPTEAVDQFVGVLRAIQARDAAAALKKAEEETATQQPAAPAITDPEAVAPVM